MRILKVFGQALLFIFLTLLTQIGGLVYFINFLTYKFTDKKVKNHLLRPVMKFSSFLILYLTATFAVVPFVAPSFGRVALPLGTTSHLRPLNFMTCLLNRNYVKPELLEVAFSVATGMNQKYPGTVINYLDANFPFIDKFPLLPHLSHNDGRKLDLSFCYNDKKTGQPTNDAPSIIGYGICEEPNATDINMAIVCEKKGYWQYSFLRKIMPQSGKENFAFDVSRTKTLVSYFAEKKEIGKIFIEPHISARLNLENQKVRFHGCQAVRHDDHIHVQLR